MTVEEKHAALEQVLESRVLRRCDQLQKMLRFICEAAIEGRADELSEYLIGVEALGRPSSYSPVEDSIVRTRAYDLRNKLAKYYGSEMPHAPIRIDIERGAYVARFHRNGHVPNAVRPGSLATEVPLLPAIAPALPQPVPRRWMLPAFIASCCVSVALAVCLWTTWPRHAKDAQPDGWTPEIETLWKPFLADATPVVLAYQSRLFINFSAAGVIVRTYLANEMSDVPHTKPLTDLQKLTGSKELIENRNYVDFGSINSMFLLMRTVGLHQNRMFLKRSQDLDWTDIFNNNVIFIGQAAVQPRLRKIMAAGDFVEDVGGIRNLHPKPGEQVFYAVENPGQNHGDKYALFSRFPGPQSGRYIVTLGSAHSELPWAITQYVTSPHSVHELMQHLKLPSGQLPEAFQLVLRITEESQVPVRIRYVTHHVVSAPEYQDSPASARKS